MAGHARGASPKQQSRVAALEQAWGDVVGRVKRGSAGGSTPLFAAKRCGSASVQAERVLARSAWMGMGAGSRKDRVGLGRGTGWGWARESGWPTSKMPLAGPRGGMGQAEWVACARRAPVRAPRMTEASDGRPRGHELPPVEGMGGAVRALMHSRMAGVDAQPILYPADGKMCWRCCGSKLPAGMQVMRVGVGALAAAGRAEFTPEGGSPPIPRWRAARRWVEAGGGWESAQLGAAGAHRRRGLVASAGSAAAWWRQRLSGRATTPHRDCTPQGAQRGEGAHRQPGRRAGRARCVRHAWVLGPCLPGSKG